MKGFHPTLGRAAILNPDGSVAWEEEFWQENFLADEGEKDILNVYFREQANPSKYLALLTADATDPTTMATMTELTTVGSGYARQQITAGQWAAPVDDGGDWRTDASAKTFGPALSVWSIRMAALVTAASGTTGVFISAIALSTVPTSVGIGQSFVYTMKQKAQ